MKAEEIINIIGGNQESGMCRCPSHDDRNPSLSVIDGDNGKPLVHCHAGCSQNDVIASLKEMGAWPDNVQQLSEAEIRAQKEVSAKRKAERVKETKAKYAKSAQKAVTIIENAKGRDPTQHQYSKEKDVNLGDRVKRGEWIKNVKDEKSGKWSKKGWVDALLIPIYSGDYNITSIQAIDADGTKDFLAGGKIKSCFHPFGEITGATGLVVIAEGAATVASVSEVMGCPGVVAFSAGNLGSVAREIKKLAPLADIVIIADDDQKPGTDSNPGKDAAMKAAEAIGCKWVIPDLGKKADAWDVRNEQGADGIRAMLSASSVASVATVAVADDEICKNRIECDLDIQPEDIQKLRYVLTFISADAKVDRHTSTQIIGWGLNHVDSNIRPEIGATLCSGWDKRTGGHSLQIFTTSDSNYRYTKPVTVASIYDLAKKGGWDGQVPWLEPLSLITHQQADPYPVGALPGLIGDAVREVTEFVQCPIALTACSALAVISVVAQGLVDVRRSPGLEGPVSLFSLAIADSGERKTSADGYFSRPVKNWDAEQAEAAKPELKKYAVESAIWEATKSGLFAAVTTASKSGKSTDDLRLRATELESDKPESPKISRLLYSDSTPEALAFSLAHNHPVGGVLSSEAGVVFGGHAMGKESAMRNMAMLNSLWDADTFTIDRKTSPSYTVRGVRLTMGLAVQYEAVRSFLDNSKGLARGIGWLARFLIAWPESTQGNRMFKEPPEYWQQLAKFHQRLGTLLDHPLQFDDKGDLSPVMLELSPEAKKTWVAFHNDVEAELLPGRDMAEAKDVASKAADNAVRLAALFHVFAKGAGGTIQEEHMKAGAALAGWHLYEARRFMGEIAVDVSTYNSLKLDAWIVSYCKEHHVSKVSRRHIQQHGPNCTRLKANLNAAMEELVDAGRVREIKEGRQRMVEVNPSLLEG